MRKVISRNGHDMVYDTETAELIHAWSDGILDIHDPRHFEQSLYLTPGGDYFVFGQGGPQSMYRRDGSKGGWGIRPLPYFKVQSWLKAHDAPDSMIDEHPIIES